MMSRALKILGLLLASIAFSPAATAASWPDKPVRIIIPWAPGGATDIIGRLTAAELTKRLKQQVLVENRSGAGGIVGMQVVAQTPPDGYTFLVTSTGYGYLIYKSKARVDLNKSFDPVALLGLSYAGLVVNPKLPVKSVADLVALAKSKPGKLNYASSGIGGYPHMNTELFKLKAGVNIVHVPFKGGGPAVADVMAGNTDMYMGSLPTAMSYINAGRLKLLAITSAKRDPHLPNVPTVAEAVPGYESDFWLGMFAPRGTPPDIIARMHATIEAALKSKELIEKFEAQGATPKEMSTADFGKMMESEAAKWTEVIQAAGIKED